MDGEGLGFRALLEDSGCSTTEHVDAPEQHAADPPTSKGLYTPKSTRHWRLPVKRIAQASTKVLMYAPRVTSNRDS